MASSSNLHFRQGILFTGLKPAPDARVGAMLSAERFTLASVYLVQMVCAV